MRCSNVWAAAKSIARSVLLLLIPPVAAAPAQSAKIILPTDNHSLFSGDSAAFYQYVRRDFEGQISNAWEGGQYGFVRNPQRIGTAILYTRFHEGIDIRPLQRDGHGEPLDVIHAIAAGKVVYINPVPSHSNYGRYIVIEHQFDGCPYYSLYAHLGAVQINIGDTVAQGDPIGVMGHTGEGIHRERAHLATQKSSVDDSGIFPGRDDLVPCAGAAVTVHGSSAAVSLVIGWSDGREVMGNFV